MRKFSQRARRDDFISGIAIALTAMSLLFATACDTNRAPLNPNYGNAVRHNMSVHIIRPRLPDPGAIAPEMEGARAFRAIDLYHRGETEKPKEETTTKRPAEGGKK